MAIVRFADSFCHLAEIKRRRKTLKYNHRDGFEVERDIEVANDGEYERLVVKFKHSYQLTLTVWEDGELYVYFWEYSEGRRSFEFGFRGRMGDQSPNSLVNTIFECGPVIGVRADSLSAKQNLIDIWADFVPYDLVNGRV